MLDEDFLEIKSRLERVRGLMEESLENYKREGFENNKVYNKLENYQIEIDDMIHYIKYMSKGTKEGLLVLRHDGRYEIGDRNDTTYFTSGSSIEVFKDGEWNTGRVESRHENDNAIYYFLNDDGKNIDLYEGLRVRVRSSY